MEDEERCDDEREVFNARVHEDEMIISIEEYKELKAMKDDYEKIIQEMKMQIAYLEKIQKEYTDEKQKMLTEMNSIYKESRQLKKGIINFLKILGG